MSGRKRGNSFVGQQSHHNIKERKIEKILKRGEMVINVWPITLLFNRTSQNDWDVNDFNYHISENYVTKNVAPLDKGPLPSLKI